MDKIRFAVVGGDQRSIKLSELLLNDGHRVEVFGFDKVLNEDTNKSLIQVINDADVVIGPLPLSNDGETLNAPFNSKDIQLKELINSITSKQIFIGGKIDKDISITEEKDVKIIDYFEREEMQILNAIPTAEGAIQLAMEKLPITVCNSNVLVLGFGRIGKVLSKMLYGIGANTYVAVRKYSDIAWLKSYGYKPVLFKELDMHLPKMDIIFNTIPSEVLNKERLEIIKKDCLTIDLASKPGGVDFKAAEMLGLRVEWALALPGKVAPITAATVIKETVYNIIEELEV